MQRQRTRQPVRQVEQMHALIDQLAAARARRIGPPLAVIADPSAVPVPRPQVHQLPVLARVNLGRQLRRSPGESGG